MTVFPEQAPGILKEYRVSHGADAAKLALFFEHFTELDPLHSKGRKVFTYAWKQALVFKYYAVPDIRVWPAPRWEREHQALKRLNGEGVPRSFGFAIRQRAERWDVIACREFAEGGHVGEIGTAQAAALAGLFAQVHRKSVTMEDPVYNNFLRQTDRFILIDMDQAKLHQGPLKTAFYTGKELANIRFKVLCRDAAAWRAFRRAYQEANPGRGPARLMRILGFAWWYWKKWWKYRLPVWFGKEPPVEGQSRVKNESVQGSDPRVQEEPEKKTASRKDRIDKRT